MADRLQVKKENERFHIANFLEWFNRAYNTDFIVISEPEPPEAIIQSSAKTIRWVELSNAFWNAPYARHLTSRATPGETHIPINSGPYGDMDQEFAKNFVSVVKIKLEKNSYKAVHDEYGPGYLVIPIYNPFFDGETINLMKEEWRDTKVNNLGCFRSVRITYRSNNQWTFHRWNI